MIDRGESKIGAERMFPTPQWINHSSMAKHTISTLQAMVGAKPTGPIDKINERPTFSNLWDLHRHIAKGICKLGNVKFPLHRHSDYILSKESFTQFSSKEWRDPEEVEEYYEIPVTVKKRRNNKHNKTNGNPINRRERHSKTLKWC